ncbi:copine viii [Stylonychia lemnae]|uniref:Copine viii n=1 Tax=Stylonychia lemnae TaxID=5949 RepID=A0A077ZZE8_STYLE|nr:copine viii [Stylonychia lemnae]|eukprot:CDW74967.1 copine viii [Stylonychia lemnae]
MGAAIGDTFTCCRKHQNTGSIASSNQKFGIGRDLDEAVLAATKDRMNQAGNLLSMLNLTFSCENLPNLDTFTRTDAMCVIYQQKGNVWHEIGRTEVIMDNLNPKFIKQFTVEYHFEERQKFRVAVYDVDDFTARASLESHDFVGSYEFMLHEIVTSKDQRLRVPLQNDKEKYRKNGFIVITGEEVQGNSNEMLELQLNGNFAQSGFLFFIICKTLPNKESIPMYKSEIKEPVQQGNFSFRWNPFKMLTSALSNEEEDRPINIEIYQSQKNNNHKNLGTGQFTLRQIREGNGQIDVFKIQKKIGSVQIFKYEFFKRYSFLEYVFGGCQINLSIAVDFTLSNGEPTQPDSLHYFDYQRNEYIQAINSVGQILQYYDSDKQIPFYGFGGSIPPYKDRASHCFAVNGDIFNPEVDGIEGVIEAYQHACKNIKLYGPTYFSEVLKMVVDVASNQQVSQENQQYFILLLITDGIINDIQKTIDEVVRGSNLPLSIIIVGVGNENFKSMDVLDADDEPLYSNVHKKYMERDIVQFVPFREFKNNPIQLAKQTLEEVPNQLISYFEKAKIVPKQVREEQKQIIKRQLSRQRTLKEENKQQELPPYFEKLKEEFIQKSIEMGINKQDLLNFLNKESIPELNYEIVLDMRNYKNVLKINPKQNNSNAQIKPNRPQQNYDYKYEDYQEESVHEFDQTDANSRSRIPMQNNNRQSIRSHKTQEVLPKQPPLVHKPSAQDECKICFSNKNNTVLVPCGHKCVCFECSSKIKNICPICRKNVAQVVKVFET